MKEIENLRKAYHKGALDRHEIPQDPMDLFRQWWHQAIEAEIDEANAMTLATGRRLWLSFCQNSIVKGPSPGWL